MPAPVSGRRPDQLTAVAGVQVLRVAFALSAEDPEIRAALAWLVQTAEQPERPRTMVRYHVRSRGHGYEIIRNGEVCDTQFDAFGVVRSLDAQIRGDALAAWPGAVVLHAVVGARHGRRFLLVGERQVDRSQLVLELLAHGARMEGDAFAILHDDGLVTALPQPFSVHGARSQLPAWAPTHDQLPEQRELPWAGVRRLDAAAAAGAWRLLTARCEMVIALETNPGGQSWIAPLSPSHMVGRLLAERRFGSAPALAIRAIARLLDGASCHRLRIGAAEDVRTVWPGEAEDWYSARVN